MHNVIISPPLVHKSQSNYVSPFTSQSSSIRKVIISSLLFTKYLFSLPSVRKYLFHQSFVQKMNSSSTTIHEVFIFFTIVHNVFPSFFISSSLVHKSQRKISLPLVTPCCFYIIYLASAKLYTFLLLYIMNFDYHLYYRSSCNYNFLHN